MGVITTCRLDEGTVFGPVPPTMTLADPIVLIGHRTCDTLPDIHTVKVRSSLRRNTYNTDENIYSPSLVDQRSIGKRKTHNNRRYIQK